MNITKSSRYSLFLTVGLWLAAGIFSFDQVPIPQSENSEIHQPQASSGTPAHGKLLYKDDFSSGLKQWKTEEEAPGHITVGHGTLTIDVPAGATIWFKPKLQGPVLIEYEATVISRGGQNDRGSDLNCFWMATDPAQSNGLLASQRHGIFAEYNTLLTYYVGLGGNGNTTTRFRRYIGSPTERPLLPENDRSEEAFLIDPNKSQVIRLLANGHEIAFYRDAQEIFHSYDPQPYVQGWFGLRTTRSHIEIRHLRIYRPV
jgi:hypothetical protein